MTRAPNPSEKADSPGADELSPETLRAANHALRRRARDKDEFAASLGHTLRSPLAGILGLAEGLRFGVYGALNPRQDEILQLIENRGRVLLWLVTYVAELAKADAGSLELEITTGAARQLAEQALQNVRAEADKKGVHVSIEAGSPELQVSADPRRLEQMLTVLLENAVHRSARGSAVQMVLDAVQSPRAPGPQGSGGDGAAGGVRFEVRDHAPRGAGNTPDELFEQCDKRNSAQAREYPDDGVGLVWAARMAKLQGGHVSASATADEQTCFSIVLPGPA